ncbi:MAG: sorbosone dehydrogenase family protein [Rhodothermales bacterium]
MKHQINRPQFRWKHLPLATQLTLALFVLISCSQTSESLEFAFPNLNFSRPVDLQHAGDESNRLYVVEQAGIIKTFDNDAQVSAAQTFLDIRERVRDNGNEEGLLGLAFHPDYESNGYFFVNYTASNPRRTVISRFSVNQENPEEADDTSELIILEIDQPYGNHNGGQLAFGPDNYLYIAIGDGGSAGDPMQNGQNRSTLLGTIARIDIDVQQEGQNYGIPADNPFAALGAPVRPEIFAYGLRNPWRISFDPDTGDLWAGDVGQNEFEEINKIDSGGNYGWNYREGKTCFEPDENCPAEDLIDPIIAYGRSSGSSVTGGYVYRGSAIPEFFGKYFYADFSSGRIWMITMDGDNVTENTELSNTNLHISSFGVDQNNELYICAFDGRIYRLGRPQ